MNDFSTVYIYELKKICMRKSVWITIGILMIIAVYMGVGKLLSTSYSVMVGQEVLSMSGWEYVAYEKANAESLTGQKIDDTMLEKVKEAYQRMHIVFSEEENEGITNTASKMTVEGIFSDEDVKKKEELAKKREQYKEIYSYINNVMRNYEAIHTINADILYQTRLSMLHSSWTEQKMTEEEKAYWLEKEKIIEKPFVYGYANGWERILEGFLTLNFMLVLAIAIGLSNICTEEHLRKTDQMILCSKYGKKFLFLAKMAAGITFGVCCGAVLLILSMVSSLCVYGTEGYDVAIQVYLPMCSWNLTMGQAVLLISLIYMIISSFYSIITVFLSEAIKNSVAVMGVITGSMIVTMLINNIPYHFRVLSQIYELLPTILPRVWQLWDNRLVYVFGRYFSNFQIAPIIYSFISIVLILWGNYLYKNYQVSGR